MTSNFFGQDGQSRPSSLRSAGQAVSTPHSRSASMTFPTPAAALADLANDISRRFNAEKAQQQNLLKQQLEQQRQRQYHAQQMQPPAKRQRLEGSNNGLPDVADYIGTLGSDQRRLDAKSSTAVAPAATPPKPVSKFPPFPPRPKPMYPRVRASNVKQTTLPAKSQDVSTKPYNLDPPKTAPQLPNGTPVDFYPWKGKQAEDALTEQTIQQGHYDKTMVSQNETGTARSIILGGVRHRNGLQALSSLFVAALEQRQMLSAVTAKNTFKLPPRVTLTDTKREAWLRDLADPVIPLRRLSRSIPHGIRGKSLLEQCLTKKIPTSRAVWLTKCVGANEIRAFKRKGTSGAFVSGGETKWVKDWTLSLNQFIESLVDACGTPDWKDNMTYGMQFVCNIYADKLLDQDGFLDGIIAAMQGATEKFLPVWMLVVGCFLKDVRSRRRRARKLIVALVDHAAKLQGMSLDDPSKDLLRRPVDLIRSLAVSHPDCFILPDCWELYEGIVQNCGDDEAFQASFETLKTRNHRVCRQRLETNSHGRLTGPQKLVALLDQASSTFTFVSLSEKCREAVKDEKVLLFTVLEWASTRFRNGQARVYLAVRLLRHWARLGLDLDKQIIAFLNDDAAVARSAPLLIYRIVAELVRSHHFSIGRYLQALMARGSALAKTDPHFKFQLELLNNVPLHGLPTHLLNLRQIILTNSSCDYEFEGRLRVAKAFCKPLAPCLADKEIDLPVPEGFELSSLNGVVRLELARWVRQTLAAYLSDNSTDDMSVDEDDKPSLLPSAEFDAICSILISVEDYSILADIHGIVIETCDVSQLPNICHSLNRSFDSFYAIGALIDLVRKCLERFGDVKGRSISDRPLFASFAALLKRMNLSKTSQKLDKELASCDTLVSLAACSPVSDQMAEALQNSDATFVEEVETLIKSGTSMDKAVMSRVFRDIAKKIEACWLDDYQMMITLFEVMAKVATFNKLVFKNLVLDWLSSALVSSKRPRVPELIVPLVCNDVVTLHDVLKCVVALARPPTKHERLVIEMHETLQYSKKSSWEPIPLTFERFTESRQSLIEHGSPLIVKLVEATLEISANGSKEASLRANENIEDAAFPAFILDILRFGTTSIHGQLAKVLMENQHALASIDEALRVGRLDTPAMENIRAIFRVADDFNVALCKLRLGMVTGDAAVLLDDAERLKLGQRLVQDLAPGFADQPQAWGWLLSELPPSAAARALAIACHNLLRLLSDSSRNPSTRPNKEDLTSLVSALLLHPAHVEEENSPTLDAFASALNAQRATLKAIPLNFAPAETDSVEFDGSRRAARIDAVTNDIVVLLEIILAHYRSLSSPRTTSAQLTRLALSLAQIYIEPALGPRADILERIFDALQFVYDAMSPEARAHTAQILDGTVTPRNTRLDFIFGLSDIDAENEWLLLQNTPGGATQDMKTPGIAASSAWPASTGSTVSSATPRAPAPGTPATAADNVRTVPVAVPYHLRRWELVPDATPIIGENDSSLSLSLFEASRAVF